MDYVEFNRMLGRCWVYAGMVSTVPLQAMLDFAATEAEAGAPVDLELISVLREVQKIASQVTP